MDGYNHNPRAGKKRIFGQSSCFRGGVIDLAFALTFQITKCICQNCQVYLLKLPHVFVYPLPNPWRNWNRLTHRAENENMDPPIWMGTITILELANRDFWTQFRLQGKGDLTFTESIFSKLSNVFVQIDTYLSLHCPILGGTETGLQLKAAPRPTDPIPSSSSAGF